MCSNLDNLAGLKEACVDKRELLCTHWSMIMTEDISQLSLQSDTATDIYRTMVRISACDKRIQQLLSAGAMQFQY